MQIVPSIDRWNGGGLLLWNILYSSFLTTTLWDPGCFDSGFSGLLLCAVMCLCKVLCFSGNSQRQLWCGVSHVYHEQTYLMSLWPMQFYSPSVLMSPQAGFGYSRWPCLLCNVAAASAGYSSRCSQLCRCQTCALCSSVCVKVMLPSFKKVICY